MAEEIDKYDKAREEFVKSITDPQPIIRPIPVGRVDETPPRQENTKEKLFKQAHIRLMKALQTVDFKKFDYSHDTMFILYDLNAETMFNGVDMNALRRRMLQKYESDYNRMMAFNQESMTVPNSPFAPPLRIPLPVDFHDTVVRFTLR